jgi:hypothetical protein
VSPVARRTVLKGLGAAAVVGGAGVVGWRVLDDEGDDPPPTTEVDALPTPAPESSLGDALVAIGGAYLEAVPEDADQAVLLAALPALEGQIPDRPGQGLRVLDEQVAADHRAGEVVELDGWVLSRTECRAAALYAL